MGKKFVEIVFAAMGAADDFGQEIRRSALPTIRSGRDVYNRWLTLVRTSKHWRWRRYIAAPERVTSFYCHGKAEIECRPFVAERARAGEPLICTKCGQHLTYKEEEQVDVCFDAPPPQADTTPNSSEQSEAE